MPERMRGEKMQFVKTAWGRLLAATAFVIMTFLAAAPEACAAAIENIRLGVEPARTRLVLDSKAPIRYKYGKEGLTIIVELPDSKKVQFAPVLKRSPIESLKFEADGEGSRLLIRLNHDCQYKVFPLKDPDRLVIDIYTIYIADKAEQLAAGIVYRSLQDEINGRQIQAHLVTAAPEAACELKPFSVPGCYTGRGKLSAYKEQRKMLAAVNASYFDKEGWVIGNVKYNNQLMAVDLQPRSACIIGFDGPKIVSGVGYKGMVTLYNGTELEVKGMNRGRIADDLVIYNEHYGASTRTNCWGREIRVQDNHAIEISDKGNMTLKPGSVVISGHGKMAKALAAVHLGDPLVIRETLGNQEADAAPVVISGGPLLLEDGRINVRSHEEYIAADIAKGRAPRTGIGLKRDGTLLLLVVDGRNNNSAGLTLAEFAAYFQRLGAAYAVNLDGGGSSEMVVGGRVVNRPSDGKERLVSIGLGLFEKPGK